jgi:hypothetical protein
MATPDDLDCSNLNTTECVLKYLKSIAQCQKVQTDDFNWDPISVYITAAICGIALCLAMVTIGHAVFSSAHGRFNASQYAIGSWHRMSNSYLNWTEMRVGPYGCSRLGPHPRYLHSGSPGRVWEKSPDNGSLRQRTKAAAHLFGLVRLPFRETPSTWSSRHLPYLEAIFSDRVIYQCLHGPRYQR